MIERKATTFMRITLADCPRGMICRRRKEKDSGMEDCPHLAGIRSTPGGLFVQCKAEDR